MARVYLETSFISACVTTRRDVASQYRRQASTDWWKNEAFRHELFTSAETLAELSNPAYPQRRRALTLLNDVPLIDLSDEIMGFAATLVRQKVMPGPVQGDAIHVAAACVGQMDYILSWNVRHLANQNKVNHLRVVCLRTGLIPPRIITPELLWQNENGR
ncbi:MAG: PIN domain-containing protein [Phycisphaerales bacterium]